MTTALALVPSPVVVEFRRCTGHCCDPVTLPVDPAYLRRSPIADERRLAELFVHLGWQPPAQGWGPSGIHLYRCRAFDRQTRTCAVHGTHWQPLICQEHPVYGGDVRKVCPVPGCTRRTMVLGGSYRRLRWRFPDLMQQDRPGCFADDWDLALP